MIKLTDVLATGLLVGRELTAEQRAMIVKKNLTLFSGATVKGTCASVMRECKSDSVGISIFNSPRYDELSWLRVVGIAAEFEGRRYPLRHSMCGVCFERNSPQLFVESQRYFQWLDLAGIRIAECLVYPIRSKSGNFIGTVWVVRHEPFKVPFSHREVTILEMASEHLRTLLESSPLAPTCG